VGSVDRAPAVLGGLDELERHGQPGGARAGSSGDLGAVPDGGEGRLDRVGNRYERPGAAGSVGLLPLARWIWSAYGATVRDEGALGVKQGGQAGLVRWAVSPR
jgi:hypothetical protein